MSDFFINSFSVSPDGFPAPIGVVTTLFSDPNGDGYPFGFDVDNNIIYAIGFDSFGDKELIKLTLSGTRTLISSAVSSPLRAYYGKDNAVYSVGGTITKWNPSTGASMTFNDPGAYSFAAAQDSSNNFYFTDLANGKVVKTDSSGNNVNYNFATIEAPRGVAVDSNDNIYVAGYYDEQIYKITPAGVKTPFVAIPEPVGITFDDKNNLYVTSFANQIYKVTLAGSATIFAGSPYPYDSGNTNGTGTAARFNTPWDIKYDKKTGFLYVLDQGTVTFRKIT